MGPRATAILTARWQGGGAVAAASRSMRGFAEQTAFSSRVVDAFGRTATRAFRGVATFLARQVTNVFRSFFFGIRIWAIVGGAAVAAFAAKSIKAFMEFDKKLRETTGLIRAAEFSRGLQGAARPGTPGGTRVTAGELRAAQQRGRAAAQAEYKAYYREALRMGPSVRRSPNELAGGIYEIAQAGFTSPRSRRPGQQILRAAAMGSSAGGGEVNTAVRSLITMINALALGRPRRGRGTGAQNLAGRGSNSAMGITDRVFQAISFGIGLDYTNLNQALGQVVGPTGTFQNPKRKAGRGTGLLNNILATMIAGTQGGMQPGKIAQGYANILQKLAHPSGKASEVYQGLGIDPQTELLKRPLFGSNGIIRLIEKAMDRHKITGGARSEMFSILFPDVRGIRLLGTMQQQTSIYAASLEILRHSLGATKQAFDEQGQSLDAQVKKFSVLWDTMKIGLGHAAAPVASRAIGFFEGYLERFTGGELGQQVSDRFAMRPQESGTGIKKGVRQGRAEFMGGLTPRQRTAYNAYQQFNRGGVGRQLKRIGGMVWDDLRAWAQRPSTAQQFKDLLQGAISTAFDLLGAAVKEMPSVYRLGMTIAAEIERGIMDQLKSLSPGNLAKSAMGGSSGGAFFHPKNAYDVVNAVAVGGIGALAVARGARGGGLMQRGVRGAGFAGAGALMGLPTAMLPLLMGLGAVGPGQATLGLRQQHSIQRAYQGIRRVIGLPVNAAAGAASRMGTALGTSGTMVARQLLVTASSVIVNGAAGARTPTPPGGPVSARGAAYTAGALAQGAVPVWNPNLGATGRWTVGGRMVSNSLATTMGLPLGGPSATVGAAAAPTSSALAPRRSVGAGVRRAVGAPGRAVGRVRRAYRTTGGGMVTAAIAGAAIQGASGGDIASIAGSAAGAAIGSLAGPIGTVVGGAIGGIAGQKIYDWLNHAKDNERAALYADNAGRIATDVFSGHLKQNAAPALMAALARTGGQGLGIALTGSHAAQMAMGRGLIMLGNARQKPAIQKALDQIALGAQAMGGTSDQLQAFINTLTDRAWQRLAEDKIAEQNSKRQVTVRGQKGTGGHVPGQDRRTNRHGPRVGLGPHSDVGLPSVAALLPFDTLLQAVMVSQGFPIGNITIPGSTVTGPKGVKMRQADKNLPTFATVAQSQDFLDILTKASTPVQARIFEKAQDVGSYWPKGIKKGVDLEQKRLDWTSTMNKMVEDAVSAASRAISGGGGRFGGGSGGTSSFGTSAPVNPDRVRGVGDGDPGRLGNAFNNAGAQLAHALMPQIGRGAANRVLSGPLGGATRALAWLQSQVGHPYIWGGGHPPALGLAGYDCSGLASTAMMVAGIPVSGTTTSMIPQIDPNGVGPIRLGFNSGDPTHMGINVLGNWFEAKGRKYGILGPGQARSNWAVTGTPKFHTGGIYRAPRPGGEGPAILRDGEMVVKATREGGLEASRGGGGPMIYVANLSVRNDSDIHAIAEQLATLLEQRSVNR